MTCTVTVVETVKDGLHLLLQQVLLSCEILSTPAAGIQAFLLKEPFHKNHIWHTGAVLQGTHAVSHSKQLYRARIFKLDPKNQFSQAVQPGGPVRQPYSYSVPSLHRLFKNSSTVLLTVCWMQQNILLSVPTMVVRAEWANIQYKEKHPPPPHPPHQLPKDF